MKFVVYNLQLLPCLTDVELLTENF